MVEKIKSQQEKFRDAEDIKRIKEHKKTPEYKKSQEYKKRKEMLANKRNKERQLAKEKKRKELEKLKLDANIEILNKTISNLNDVAKDNIDIRTKTNLMIKTVDFLRKNEVKKWLDESLDNSISAFNTVYDKTIETFKSSNLDTDNRQKIYTLLEDLNSNLDALSKEPEIAEKFVDIISKNEENMEFIADWKDVLYAHIKKANEKFLSHFNCLYISAEKFSVPPELLVAIMQNDSSLWGQLKTKNNFWNVWNDDFGNTKSFDTAQDWIDAVAANIKKRILKYCRIYPKREPTAKELVSWIAYNWRRFYWAYMTSKHWQKKVAWLYKHLSNKSIVETEDIS